MKAIEDLQARSRLAKNEDVIEFKNTFKNKDLTRIFVCVNDLSLPLLETANDMRKEAQCSTDKHDRVKKRAQLMVQLSPLVTGNPMVRALDHSPYPSSKQWVQLNFDSERAADSLIRHAEKRPPVPGAICEQKSP